MVLELLSILRWKERAQAHEGHQRIFAGCQECGYPMRVASGDTGSQNGVIVMFHIAWI
jgi:hypothetical protein